MAIKIMLNECMNHLGVDCCRTSLIVPFCRTAVGNSEECGKLKKKSSSVSSWFTKQHKTKKAVETPESQKCILFKEKTDGSEEDKGEEVVNKPVRAMPKKSRNPFLSEKYVEIPASLGSPALGGGGALCRRCGAGGGRQGALAERGRSGRRRVGCVLASCLLLRRGTFRSGQSSALGLKVRGS